MNLHEYQAKALFAAYGMPIPRGSVCRSAQEAIAAAQDISDEQWIVKAQVHAGGRGKAGGVKLVHSLQEVEEAATALLGTNLVTYQTTAEGQPINQLLIEEVSSIKNELYLGGLVDRATRRIVIMASTEGGVDIEKVAAETPEKIHKIYIDPTAGLMPWQCRQLGFALQLSGEAFRDFSHLLKGICKLFQEKDLSLVEVNPLIETTEGRLLCLDGKINIDSNAIYRHPDLEALRDISQENARELQAAKWDLNYVSLDGSIGCMVNGAGLAMATMDVIKLKGGNPANFLDVGGTATAERVAEAFKIIISDSKVNGILVNIFGGIVRCDLIAEGIIEAVKTVGLNLPVVVRLEGNMAEKGIEMLNQSGLNLESAHHLDEAAEKIITLAGTSS